MLLLGRQKWSRQKIICSLIIYLFLLLFEKCFWFPLSYLLYQFRTGFYSYGGSLTEPPCYQGAEWFLFPEPLAISERQLNEFRQLLSKDGKTRILRNSRPVQSINCTRVVNLNQYNPIDACQMEPPVSEVQCEDEESFE